MPNTQPIPTTDTTTPIADSIPQPTTGPVATTEPAAEETLPAHPDTDAGPTDLESPAQWSPDIAAIAAAQGDPTVWAKQFYELVGYTTGKWIDEESLREWLSSFAQQVAQSTYRSSFFAIANATVPANLTGDPALQLLQFRDDLARSFRPSAGL